MFNPCHNVVLDHANELGLSGNSTLPLAQGVEDAAHNLLLLPLVKTYQVTQVVGQHLRSSKQKVDSVSDGCEATLWQCGPVQRACISIEQFIELYQVQTNPTGPTELYAHPLDCADALPCAR